MKRILFTVLCAAAVAAFGEETTVTNVAFGIYPVTSNLKNTIVAISLRGMDGEPVAVSNLVKTTNLTPGDKLYTFEDGKYEEWTLQNGSWGKVEKKFTMDSSGQLVEDAGTDASTVQLAVGSGIWLVRNDSYVHGTSFTFYLYGKPESNPVSTTDAGEWTLIGNPTKEAKTIGIKEGQVEVEGATDGDMLVMPVQAAGGLRRYTFKSTKGWRAMNDDGTAWDQTPPTLASGLGCWIQTKITATITW